MENITKDKILSFVSKSNWMFQSSERKKDPTGWNRKIGMCISLVELIWSNSCGSMALALVLLGAEWKHKKWVCLCRPGVAHFNGKSSCRIQGKHCKLYPAGYYPPGSRSSSRASSRARSGLRSQVFFHTRCIWGSAVGEFKKITPLMHKLLFTLW